MTMDCLIIHPGAQHGIYGSLGDRLTALEPPTWARMIAGYLADRGYDAAICDAEALRLSPEQVAAYAASCNPRLVVIVVCGHQPSASTQQMVAASATALAIKKANPSQTVVMTGNHPSALPERTMYEEVVVDYVVDGEGPVTIDALLRCEDLESIPGLVWRDLAGEVHHNPPAPLIKDLDRDLHGRAWGRLPMSLYRAHNWQVLGRDPAERSPYASLYTSLNCPFACSFCMISAMFHNHKYRTFSPEMIGEQIAGLHSVYGVRTFKIADEMFVLNPSHYLAICDEIIRRGLGHKLNLWAYARVDTVKPENLGKLRDAGFRWLALGIESGNAAIRDGADKRLRRDDIVDVVRTIQNAGISVIGNFMFGLPGDTAATMQETLDLALAARPEFANFYSTMAYPGSKLYEETARDRPWTLPAGWRGYSQHNWDCQPLPTDALTAAEVLRFRDGAFRTFYGDATWRRYLWSRFGQAAIDDVDLMLSYSLPRRLLGHSPP